MIPLMKVLLWSLPLLASAQGLQPYVQFNGSSPGPHDGFTTFQNADRVTSATHDVTFNANEQHWTWTLQISNVSLPNISSSVENAHVAYTTWHFAVAGNENTRASSSPPTCVSLLDMNFPSNVSNAWNSSSASCTSALGSECEQAILDGTFATDDCVSGNFAPSSLDFLHTCRSAFGPDGFTTMAYPFNANNVTDGTFAWAISDPYNPNNSSSIFNAAEEKLRLMILTGEGGKQVLCNRVFNETASDTSDASETPPTSAPLIFACSMLLTVATLLI